MEGPYLDKKIVPFPQGAANDNGPREPDAVIVPRPRPEAPAGLDGAKFSSLKSVLARIHEQDPSALAPERVAHAKVALTNFPHGHLLHLINGSNPERWQTHPHFYQAVIEELEKEPTDE